MLDIISSRRAAIVPLFSHSSHIWLVIYARRQAVNYDLLVVINGHSVSNCLLQQKYRVSFLSLSLAFKRKSLSGTREFMLVYDKKLQNGLACLTTCKALSLHVGIVRLLSNCKITYQF